MRTVENSFKNGAAGVVKYGMTKGDLIWREQGSTDLVYTYIYGKDVGGMTYQVWGNDKYVLEGGGGLEAVGKAGPVHGGYAEWEGRAAWQAACCALGADGVIHAPLSAPPL